MYVLISISITTITKIKTHYSYVFCRFVIFRNITATEDEISRKHDFMIPCFYYPSIISNLFRNYSRLFVCVRFRHDNIHSHCNEIDYLLHIMCCLVDTCFNSSETIIYVCRRVRVYVCICFHCRYTTA